jgi:uncharacterized protein YgbK (DUF1537 family)
VVVDAVTEEDLHAIGAAVASAPLLTGGSGVAIGLPANFREAGLLSEAASAFRANPGPALVLSGSCSNATRAQVTRYAASRPAFEIDVEALLAGDPVLDRADAFASAQMGDAPLLYSSAEPERVAAMQARHGRERTAEMVEALFGALAVRAVARGVGRIVSAGGETSGAVVSALHVSALDIGPEIDPGVPALSAPDGLALALKSGNFGGPDFLERAVQVLGGGDG